MASIHRNLRDASVVFPTDPLRQTEFTVKLTDEELKSLYWEARKLIMADEMAELLEQKGYPAQFQQTLIEMAENLMGRVESSDTFHQIEEMCFDHMMEEDYPEIESEDE